MAKSKKKSPYDATLNLPQTEFPMRANLPAKEPEILRTTQIGRASCRERV